MSAQFTGESITNNLYIRGFFHSRLTGYLTWNNTKTSSTLWIDPAKTSSDLTTLISYGFLKIFIYLLLYHSWFSFKRKRDHFLSALGPERHKPRQPRSQGTPPHPGLPPAPPSSSPDGPGAQCNCRDCSLGDLQTEAGFRSLMISLNNLNTKFRNSKV